MIFLNRGVSATDYGTLLCIQSCIYTQIILIYNYYSNLELNNSRLLFHCIRAV